ncbi:MAG: hypothetical protein KAV99_01550 [Candidatus Latescibacteria bacterium]|nr:hypothetical protein [Candidatus Latescibacterota bacterium]
MTTIIGAWIAAALTLFIFSFLYKDNPFYKLAEHIFVGVSAGYWVVYEVRNVVIPNMIEPVSQGRYIYIVSGIMGLMMLTRVLPKIGWLSRWAIAFTVGMTSGYFLVTYLQSHALEQVRATLLPLNSPNNILIIVGVLTALIYFFFSKEHKGVFGKTAKVGIWFLMIAFGASFGYTVMARVSLLIGRMHFLLSDWLRLID